MDRKKWGQIISRRVHRNPKGSRIFKKKINLGPSKLLQKTRRALATRTIANIDNFVITNIDKFVINPWIYEKLIITIHNTQNCQEIRVYHGKKNPHITWKADYLLMHKLDVCKEYRVRVFIVVNLLLNRVNTQKTNPYA